jgi:hypothetical protein
LTSLKKEASVASLISGSKVAMSNSNSSNSSSSSNTTHYSSEDSSSVFVESETIFRRGIETYESLYDSVTEDGFLEIPHETFKLCLEVLESEERIITSYLESEDRVVYKARDGLKWAEVKDFINPIKKAIMIQLIQNPKSFFILFNTQKGKAVLSASRIEEWSRIPTQKTVPLIVVSNDTTLADQTAESYTRRFGLDGKKLFLLSSSSVKQSIAEMIYYIDAYRSNNDYPMPVIIGLANATQIAKIIRIIQHICDRHLSSSGLLPLYYAILADEADSTYPGLVRNSFSPYIIDDDTALHEVGFITASDGPLIDDVDNYPECSNARFIQSKIDPKDEANYRAFHHPSEAVHKFIDCPRKSSNNTLAMKVLRENDAYWKESIVLKSGELYKRKLIVNSNARGTDMRDFAIEATGLGFHAITFNQSGISIYRAGMSSLRIRTKGRRLNEILFYAYKCFSLQDKPLIVLGRKKVDRGLGFHHAPRGTVPKRIEFNFDHGPIVTDDIEGLIFTDMFMGRIECKSTAVQKAGRLAGIIAQCPQYPGSLTWWVDEETGRSVNHHNRIVDGMNILGGCHTALQAKTTATAIIDKDEPPVEHVKDKEYRIFDSQEEAITFAKKDLGHKFQKRTTCDAPEELKEGGKNPTIEYLLKRWWGINKVSPQRMCPIIDNRWCVYWRPSLIKISCEVPANKEST